MLAGCGGSQPPVSPQGAIPQTSAIAAHAERAKPWMLPEAKQVSLLYGFLGSPDGEAPWGSLTSVPDSRAMIGTTQAGGDSRNDGTIYEVSFDGAVQWSEKVLYAFSGYPDGSNPLASIRFVKTSAGTTPVLTTEHGGANQYGAVISVSLTGKENVLYSFAREPDGNYPSCSVAADKNGDLFGTTTDGGTNNLGSVWELKPQGSTYSEHIIYSFGRGYDGNYPYAGVVIGPKGVLFGTTSSGGKALLGTAFELKPHGTGYAETIIHSFGETSADGTFAYSGLTADGKGNLYGTAEEGGKYGYGVVYELSPHGSTWDEHILWNFGSSATDGSYPYLGNVELDEKGDVYGTTAETGSGYYYYQGTFFVLALSGTSYKETTFEYSGINGATPIGGPAADAKGNVYVATSSGGERDDGTIGVYDRKLLPGKMKNSP
jgi:uncharacterized repeat protein (TIGR03803 family)